MPLKRVMVASAWRQGRYVCACQVSKSMRS